MVRARKSHGFDEEDVKHGKLPPAYCGKAGGNKYVIYVHYPFEGDTISRVLIWTVDQLYAGAYVMRHLLGPNGAWEDRPPFGARESVVTDLGIIISMYNRDHLETMLNFEPTAAEAEWEDSFVYKAIMQLKYGKFNVRRSEDDTDGSSDEDRPGSLRETGDEHQPGILNVGSRREGRDDRPKPDRAKTPRLNTDGYITAGDIGAELKEEPRIIRGVLRSLKFQKPEHGAWAWPKEEAARIKVQVIAELKKGKKR